MNKEREDWLKRVDVYLDVADVKALKFVFWFLRARYEMGKEKDGVA